MNNIKNQIIILLSTELFLVSLLFKEYQLMNNILITVSVLILMKFVVKILITSIKKKKIFNYNNTIIIPIIIVLLVQKNLNQINILLVLYISLITIYDYLTSNNLYNKIKNNEYITILKKNKGKKISISKLKKDTYVEILSNQLIPLNSILISDKAIIEDNFLNNKKIINIKKGKHINFLSTNIGDKIIIEVKEDYKDSSYKELYDTIVNYDNSCKNLLYFTKIYSILIKIVAFLYILVPFLTSNYIEKNYLLNVMILLIISDNKIITEFINVIFINYFCRQLNNKIVVKNRSSINKIAKIKNFIFRKKGIITENELTIDKVETNDFNNFFYYLNHGEYLCNNEIANTIKKYNDQKINPKAIKNYEFIESLGIKVKVDGKKVLIGNSYFMQENKIPIDKLKKVATIIYLVVDKELLGHIEISDKIRKNVIEDIKNFNEKIALKTIIFSGDNERIVNAISSELQIKEKYSNLQEKDKLFWLNYINENSSGLTGYIGDIEKDKKIIDNVDISLGYYKNKKDLEKYDIIILDNRLSNLTKLFKMSKKYSFGIKTIITTYILLKVLLFIIYLLGITNIFIYLFIEIIYFFILNLIKHIIIRRTKDE